MSREEQWLLCPVCGAKTRLRLLQRTERDFAAKQPFPFVNSIQLQQWMHLSSRM